MTVFHKPPTRFGLETCQDMYAKLKWDAQNLANGWKIYDIYNFVVTANHLYVDWINNCGSPESKAKKGLLPESAKKVMQSIIDLSISCKHWKSEHDSSLKRQIINSPPERCINDWGAYLEGHPEGVMLFITFDGYKLSIKELTGLVLSYFKWIFEDDATAFPYELQNQLETYKIANMTNGGQVLH